jgi:hypothetical protein
MRSNTEARGSSSGSLRHARLGLSMDFCKALGRSASWKRFGR